MLFLLGLLRYRYQPKKSMILRRVQAQRHAVPVGGSYFLQKTYLLI